MTTTAAIQPYYDRDGITIYHGDYRDVLPTLEQPDLLFLDPPFDEWANVTMLPNAATTVAFTNHQNRRYVDSILGVPRTELIWNFMDGRWVSHSLPRITHETILVYGDIGDAYVGRRSDGVARDKGHGAVGRDKMARRTYRPRERMQLNSVLFYPRNTSNVMGLWGKPEPLMRDILAWLPGDLILDPFMGSGTTLRAAKDLDRRAIGIEIEERYCEIAVKRLMQEVLL